MAKAKTFCAESMFEAIDNTEQFNPEFVTTKSESATIEMGKDRKWSTNHMEKRLKIQKCYRGHTPRFEWPSVSLTRTLKQ